MVKFKPQHRQAANVGSLSKALNPQLFGYIPPKLKIQISVIVALPQTGSALEQSPCVLTD